MTGTGIDDLTDTETEIGTVIGIATVTVTGTEIMGGKTTTGGTGIDEAIIIKPLPMLPVSVQYLFIILYQNILQLYFKFVYH